MGIDINQLEMIKVSVQEIKALQIISCDEPDLTELEQTCFTRPIISQHSDALCKFPFVSADIRN